MSGVAARLIHLHTATPDYLTTIVYFHTYASHTIPRLFPGGR